MSQQEQKKGPQTAGPRIHAQLAAIMAAVGAVGKDRENKQQGFKFRGIEDVMDALHPIFAEQKVFILSEVLDERTEERAAKSGGNLIYRVLKVRVSFVSGEDGSQLAVVVVGEGMDSGDKAANKAMSAALKYALTQTLILPYGQVDGDADTPPESRPGGTSNAQRPTPKVEPEKPAGERRSAYDGRVLQPGESPLPKEPPAAEPTAFHARLYSALALAGVTAQELEGYLHGRGILPRSVAIDDAPEKLVTALLDGRDKGSGRNNMDLVMDNIRRARSTGQGRSA